MPAESDFRAHDVASLVFQLGRISHAYVEGIPPARWSALRYFASANRFSRNVSAFATFHSTTRGSASQTVKALVAQGYLSRTRLPQDGRRARIDLTEKGKELLLLDPYAILETAAAELPTGTRNQLATGLERLLGRLVHEHGKQWFGNCAACSHLEEHDEMQFECTLVGEKLEESELKQSCVDFRPAKNPPQRTVAG
jgi:DNA-binding MarR family transcriptional regulator